MGFVRGSEIQLNDMGRHRRSNASLRDSHSFLCVGVVDLKELQRAHAIIGQHQGWVQRYNILKRIGPLSLLWKAAVSLDVYAHIEIWVQLENPAGDLLCESAFLGIGGFLAENLLDILKERYPCLLVFHIRVFSGSCLWHDPLLHNSDINCALRHHPHQWNLVDVMGLQRYRHGRVRLFFLELLLSVLLVVVKRVVIALELVRALGDVPSRSSLHVLGIAKELLLRMSPLIIELGLFHFIDFAAPVRTQLTSILQSFLASPRFRRLAALRIPIVELHRLGLRLRSAGCTGFLIARRHALRWWWLLRRLGQCGRLPHWRLRFGSMRAKLSQPEYQCDMVAHIVDKQQLGLEVDYPLLTLRVDVHNDVYIAGWVRHPLHRQSTRSCAL